MFQVRELLIGSLAVVGVTGLGLDIYELWKKFWNIQRREAKVFYKVMFIPENNTHITMNLDDRLMSPSEIANAVKGENISAIIHIIDSAKRTIDICVMAFCSTILSSAVVRAQKRGVFVRVITDHSMAGLSGSQVEHLLENCVVLVFGSTTKTLHHKFALIDVSLHEHHIDGVIMHGSFNWTLAAMLKNHENFMITNDPQITIPYKKYFEKLWSSFTTVRQELKL